MCASLQKASKIHIGTRYLKTTVREEDDLFLITQLRGSFAEPPTGTEACIKPGKGRQEQQKVFFSCWELVQPLGRSPHPCSDMAFAVLHMFRCQ